MFGKRVRKFLAMTLAAACICTSVPTSALELSLETESEASVQEVTVETEAETVAVETEAQTLQTEAPAQSEASQSETTAQTEAQAETQQQTTASESATVAGVSEGGEAVTVGETETESEGEITLSLKEKESEEDGVKTVKVKADLSEVSDTEIRLYFWSLNTAEIEDFPEEPEEWRAYLTDVLELAVPDGLDEESMLEVNVTAGDGSKSAVKAEYVIERDEENPEIVTAAYLSIALPGGDSSSFKLDLALLEDAEITEEVSLFLIAAAYDSETEETTILDGLQVTWEYEEPEAVTEAVAESETESETEAAAEAVTETDTEVLTESETEVQTENEPVTEYELNSEEEAYGWVELVTTEGGSISASFVYGGETYEIGTYTYDVMEYGPWEAQYETTGELSVTAAADAGYELDAITVAYEDGTVIDESDTGAISVIPDEEQKLVVTASFVESDDMDDPDTYATGTYTEEGISTLAENSSYLWWFDNYYVNEDDSYHVEETDDFKLKYQIEFHTSEELEVGQVEIRIPAVLYTDRNGEAKLPDDIGVPSGTPDSYTESTSTPFNWYLDETTNELVFWNYRTITSGSNASFQVLYKDIDIMDVVDETTWSLTPTAAVTKDNGSVETQTGTAMTGHVDTGVVLTSVTKTAYYATGKSYTPALYTENQVSSYIDGDLPDEYSGDNFSNYKYVVWKITVKGDATQPWSLTTEEITSLAGIALDTEVVGYKWIREVSSDYYASKYGWENGTVTYSEERIIKMKFYVVTAYPVDDIEEGDELENTITQIITPADGYDEVQRLSASDEYTYVNYDWTYSGNIIGIDKWSGSSGSERYITYSAWLDIFENNQAVSEDTESFPFYGYSRCYGYGYTHNTLGENQTGVGSATNLGDYIDGTYYQVTTYDDVVYAYPESDSDDAVILTSEDYYFSSVKFVFQDYDYDVYEDTTVSAVTTDDVDQGYYIYAMFYGSDEWEQVDYVEWDGTGKLTYTFSSEDIAREPYRVKAVHNATGYVTYCWYYVDVALKYDSPTILAMQAEYGSDLDELTIENISGVSGEQFTSAGSQGFFHDQTTANGNYSEPGLEDHTNAIYGMLLMRDSAFATLTRLEKHADSTKYGVAENDADNSRVLVDYYLTAYEGYLVPDADTKNVLESQGISLPDRTEVVYYDLLPYGMKFNASAGVTVGRITTIKGTTWLTQPRAWDQSDISVTVGDEDVIENWNGTGRTMVIFHITYTGDDPSVYSDGMWLQGYAIHFQAYYDWIDMGSVNTEYNIAAYMPETGDLVPLYGAEDEVYNDDGVVPTTVNDDYSPFTCGDINEDGVTNIRNILYARNLTIADVATAATNSIVKLVKADDDTFASFTTTTAVGLSRGYTYEITVTNTSNGTMSDIVIYDVLEDALDRVDVQGETVFLDTDGSWTGTFSGLVTDSLTSQGIAPVVYYNASRDAVISEGTQLPSSVLTTANGWYTSDEWESLGYSLSDVKAIAVDISTNADGTSFTLDSGELVSFQIKMQAPDEVQTYAYAYNNPSFYNVTTKKDGTTDSATVIGTAVRVELADTGTVEVSKQFGTERDVPSSWLDQEFEFTISRNGSVLSNQKYVLYTYENGEWTADSVVKSTDVNGKFSIKANQKAVFSNVPDYTNVEVSETAQVFFSTEYERTDGDGTVSWLFTNTYRSAVYATKSVNLLGLDIATDEYEFTYQITVYDGSDYVPLANAEYYIVSEASSDGVGATVLGSGTTDADGKFTIHAGEIIALFPGEVGTQYRIQETDTTDDFTALKDLAEGTVKELGVTSTITNLYRWHYLTVVKEVTEQDAADCTSVFTFVITDNNGDPVAGKRVVSVDNDGNETTSVTGADGSFTITGANSATIYGLEAGVTYTVTETGYDETLYEPENGGTVSTSIGKYVAGKNVTITNQYLLRDLEVRKLVVTNDEDTTDLSTREFTFVLEKQDGDTYTAVSDYPYTIDGVEYTTGSDGSFVLKTGETAVFEDIGYDNDVFQITEAADADYPQAYPSNGDPGYVTLAKETETILFINGLSDMVIIEKQVYGLDDAGEAFVNLLKADNTQEVLLSGQYSVPVTIVVYDTNGDPVEDGDYTVIAVTQEGEVTKSAFMGVLETELKPYDYLFLADLPDGYTVKVTESADWELLYAAVASDYRSSVGSYILSEAVTSEAEAVAGEDSASAILVNSIGSADAASEIYKLMSDSSSEVTTGAKLVIQIQKYNGSVWEAVSGIRYILMDDNGATSGIQTTGEDGKIALYKTENGYPSVRFLDSKVYVNVYTDMVSGDLRAVELTDESDDAWGILSSYESESYIGNAVTLAKGNAFVNANDSGSELIIEKVVAGNDDGTFTFQVSHILSATEVPVTSEDQILASEAGSGLYYAVYDASTDMFVSEGYTDENGRLTMEAGQYAVVTIPDDTLWAVYELQQAGYELVNVTVDGDSVNLSGNTAYVSEEKELQAVEAFAIYSADDGSLTFYRSKSTPAVGDVYNGKTVTALYTGFETATYGSYSKIPWYSYRTSIQSVSIEAEIAPMSTAYWFYGFSNCTSFDLEKLDTSNVTSMSYMFYYCSGLTSLDVSSFNTSNVTSMSHMFRGCSGLTSLDVSGFNTSNVTDMSSMFNGCSGLTSLDVSGFDTSNVTSMGYMFNGCSGLTSLDVSGFDTSNVTDMSSMFYNCEKLTSLDLSGFDTSNVTSMSYMFYNCKKLTGLDVSGFDTSNVTDMSSMFNGCSGLTSLDVSGFDTSNVTDMSSMFSGCSGLTSLDVSGFDTSNVTSMSYIFYNCKKLTGLDVSGFDTSNVTSMGYMFRGCSGLTSLDVSGFNTSNVTDMGSMFYNCEKLTSLDLSGFDTSNVTSMSSMFMYCSKLTSLDLSSFDTSNVADMYRMFMYCSELTTIYVSSTTWVTASRVTDMFHECGTDTLTYV